MSTVDQRQSIFLQFWIGIIVSGELVSSINSFKITILSAELSKSKWRMQILIMQMNTPLTVTRKNNVCIY